MSEGEAVSLSNGTKGKRITDLERGPALTFQVDDRYVTLRSEDGSLSRASIEQIAASVGKVSVN